MKVIFPKFYNTLEDEVGEVQYIRTVVISQLEKQDEEEYFVFGLKKMNREIVPMKVSKEVPVLVRN